MMHPGLGQPLPHAQRCIYMDYNATTPVFPQVAHAMLPFVTEHFGNPSSIHTYGRTCKAGVDKARSQLSRLVGSKPSEVFFTACGTESDNWAVYGTVMAARSRWGVGSGRVPHVVCSKIEHPAVLVYLQHLKDQGLLAFTEVPCDDEGLISPDDVVAALTPDTVLVTIMHSNNEVGSVQPIAAITTAVHAAAAPGTVLIHTDAAQSMGKVQVLVDEMGVDMCTIVGHKFGAPKGVAALYIKDGVQLNSYLHGGGQEAGRRAGTENIILVVGMGEAAEIAAQEAADTAAHMTSMRERLLNGLLKGLPPDVVRVNGPKDGSCRLPNTLSISIRGLNASQALLQLQDQLAASAGAACHSSGHSSISSVLKAMGVDPEFAMGTLRLSTGRHTTPEEVDTAVQLILGQPLDINKYMELTSDPGAGAITTFSGVTRNNFNGKEVLKLEYEAYVPMALKKLQEVCDTAHQKWQLIKVALAHRVGEVPVKEPSVIIAASSAHRQAALEAVHWMIDELKAVVPIWKKEFFADGSQWKENMESRQRLLQEQQTAKSQ